MKKTILITCTTASILITLFFLMMILNGIYSIIFIQKTEYEKSKMIFLLIFPTLILFIFSSISYFLYKKTAN